MAHLVMGAIPSLIPKLYQLLEKEYNLQTGLKDRIKTLTQELELAQAALCKVGEVPWNQLDKQVQIWARKVREASYDMEDVLDTFLVRVVEGPDSTKEKQRLHKYLKKVTNFFKKGMARRKINGDVKNIMTHLQEVTEQCRRYKVEDIATRTATESTTDPRLHAMYTQVKKLVGMDKSSGELMSMLEWNPQRGDVSSMKMKIVSIVGVGGLGKTTLAKVVYDKIKGDFGCAAFVPVGQNADLKKILMAILIDLNRQKYLYIHTAGLDERQLIDELRNLFLQKMMRYIIVIDDLWEERSWETLKLAIADDKCCEGRIIITTRKREVAKHADEVYVLPALPPGSSRKLFYTRIYGDERKYVDYQPDGVSNEILQKCAGIPLAIITMASLLVDKPRDRWSEVYKSIGFGCRVNEEAENIMKKILSFSYYDLPSHLRTCLLYLSAFPEDSFIPKVPLIWMWVAEGLVQKKNGKGLFETGEGYFNDLVNRCLIQDVKINDIERNHSHKYLVHDMVLDFILSMSREQNFFTVFDNNNQGTFVRGNVVRRLALHNETMVHSNHLANMLDFDMSKVRSFITMEWGIDTWAPISSFKLLRVLNIEIAYGEAYGEAEALSDVSHNRFEHLGHLHHLRFLGIYGRGIKKIPEEVGALKMLQTLDLFSARIEEVPSSTSLPTQLVCLRVSFGYIVHGAEMFSIGRLTSLEELTIRFTEPNVEASRQLVKELGSLRELRVLDARIFLHDEMGRELVESVCHLHKLQHLEIGVDSCYVFRRQRELALPGDLRTFLLRHVAKPWKLPSCIDPLFHRNLSDLDLNLDHLDHQDLITLGGLPQLCFLCLQLQRASLTVLNISDSDACYFPNLRSFRLIRSMVWFDANEGDDGKKTVSFHIGDGEVEDGIGITVPSVSEAELQGDNSPVSDEEKKEGSISTGEGEGQGQGAAKPRFMPRLQELHFWVRGQAVLDLRYCSNLGLEFLSSLQEIRVWILRPESTHSYSIQQHQSVKAALRRAAQVHPNHPRLHIWN